MIPKRYRIVSTQRDTEDVFTLVLTPLEEPIPSFKPGQFNMLYHYGFGEVPISMSGDPLQQNELSHTIRAVGSVTKGLQRLTAGDEIGVRGPFGSAWPLDTVQENILIVAGGVGMAPLKPALMQMAKNRSQYKNITLLYGARSPADILFKGETEEWRQQGIDIKISVDKGDDHWRGNVGVITQLIHKSLPFPKNTTIYLSGPEIMMRFAIQEILRFDVPEEQIYLSMERNMKCAVGFCGHCQFGPYFLCKDGPVFSLNQVKSWMAIREL